MYFYNTYKIALHVLLDYVTDNKYPVGKSLKYRFKYGLYQTNLNGLFYWKEMADAISSCYRGLSI